MARQKPRKPFPTQSESSDSEPAQRGYISNERSGIFGFLSDRGVRETIESIVVAVILALLFRTFEAEAFVIPTGSMAPSLQGQHRDINCDQCGYLYQTGASQESSTYALKDRRYNSSAFCPICQYKTTMSDKKADHNSNSGDRILVNKFVYDFSEPQRFDVIVFKNPNNGKQNYIKRLIGLPGEFLIVENGDIFAVVTSKSGISKREIIRKPSQKLRAMLQLIDDTHYIPQKMHDAGWPLRWQQWSLTDGESGWDATLTSGKPNFQVSSGDQTDWLRYRHLIPLTRPSFPSNPTGRSGYVELSEWDDIEIGELPKRMQSESPQGRLITDYYCYNHRIYEDYDDRGVQQVYDPSLAMHWVGDLAVESWANVKSDSGKLKVQLVEGGAKFTCTIDVETGTATLDCNRNTVEFKDASGSVVEQPTAETSLKGKGNYRILFANVDDQIHLSINNRFVKFDAPTYERTDPTLPRSFPNDPDDHGDAEPAAIGAQNLDVEISRLKMLRDVYYTSPKSMDQDFIGNENMVGASQGRGQMRQIEKVWKIYDNPKLWESSAAKALFSERFRTDPYVFQLDEDQFLPMGDNSPASLDGRVWNGPKYVHRDKLIGRALFIYWPHSLNSPVKYFPNFGKMKFIR